MRKFAGVLVAAVLFVPAALVAAPAGAAVKGSTCTSLTGAATLKPGLSNTTALNKPTATIKNAKLAGCNNGVKTGTLSATLKWGKANNCIGLATGKSSNITGTGKVVWNDKSTSALSLKLVGVTGKATQVTIPGTAGKFKGSKVSGKIEFKIPTGQCGTKPLTSPTFKSIGKVVI